ncbi:hypothetical protein EDB86DRAFT_3074402 [Lactarius hatsudake]|nr:hypothetical protein EDB86DRAFT_3074402 [Lactarius hatsudake]
MFPSTLAFSPPIACIYDTLYLHIAYMLRFFVEDLVDDPTGWSAQHLNKASIPSITTFQTPPPRSHQRTPPAHPDCPLPAPQPLVSGPPRITFLDLSTSRLSDPDVRKLHRSLRHLVLDRRDLVDDARARLGRLCASLYACAQRPPSGPGTRRRASSRACRRCTRCHRRSRRVLLAEFRRCCGEAVVMFNMFNWIARRVTRAIRESLDEFMNR